MKKNINAKDRIIRLIIAFILLGCAAWKNSLLLLLFGVFTLLEAVFSWCIVYRFLGINSCKIPRKK